MSAEDVIAAALERRLGSLPLGRRIKVVLDRNTFDGVRTRPGPHPVGVLERTLGGLRIKLLNTQAGEEARALLQDDLLDVRIDREAVHLE